MRAVEERSRAASAAAGGRRRQLGAQQPRPRRHRAHLQSWLKARWSWPAAPLSARSDILPEAVGCSSHAVWWVVSIDRNKQVADKYSGALAHPDRGKGSPCCMGPHAAVSSLATNWLYILNL